MKQFVALALFIVILATVCSGGSDDDRVHFASDDQETQSDEPFRVRERQRQREREYERERDRYRGGSDSRRRYDYDDGEEYYGGGFGGGGFGGFGGYRGNDICKKSKENGEFCRAIPSDREREGDKYGQEALGRHIAHFTLQLFKASAASNPSDFVLSGISPEIILSYLNWVSDGSTKNQMVTAGVLESPHGMNKLVRSLLSDGKKRDINIATAFFYGKDIKMNKFFTEKSKENVDLVNVDFGNTQEATKTIRKWAEGKTKHGLDLGDLTFPADTKLSLVSTLFYKSNWIFKFEETAPGPFYLESGETIQVPIMKINRKYNAGKIRDFAEWGSIPYESPESLIIILPNEGVRLDEAIQKLTSEDISQVCENSHEDSSTYNLTISMPKFRIESNTNLVAPLKKMGVNRIFSPSAEFPFLSDESLQVSSAHQKASMDVNEEGIIVISTTVVHAVALSIQRDPPKRTFNVNRPFLAFVCEFKRNMPLVMAKITNPKY